MRSGSRARTTSPVKPRRFGRHLDGKEDRLTGRRLHPGLTPPREKQAWYNVVPPGQLRNAGSRRERLRNQPGPLVQRPASPPLYPKNIRPHLRFTLRLNLRSDGRPSLPLRKAAIPGWVLRKFGLTPSRLLCGFASPLESGHSFPRGRTWRVYRAPAGEGRRTCPAGPPR